MRSLQRQGKKESRFQGSTTAMESRRLSHLQREKNFPNSPAKQKRTVGTNAGVFL